MSHFYHELKVDGLRSGGRSATEETDLFRKCNGDHRGLPENCRMPNPNLKSRPCHVKMGKFNILLLFLFQMTIHVTANDLKQFDNFISTFHKNYTNDTSKYWEKYSIFKVGIHSRLVTCCLTSEGAFGVDLTLLCKELPKRYFIVL